MKTNVILIEKDVPIPKLRHNGGKVKYRFLDKMEIGDSFINNALSISYFIKTLIIVLIIKTLRSTLCGLVNLMWPKADI